MEKEEKFIEVFSGDNKELKEILDKLSPEGKRILSEATNKIMFEKLTASQKYDVISKALKDENTPEAKKVVLEAALKELKPLIYREQKIGTIGDRYPESTVAFRVLGIIALLVGLFFFGAGFLQGATWAGWVGIILIFFSISFLSSTKKKVS